MGGATLMFLKENPILSPIIGKVHFFRENNNTLNDGCLRHPCPKWRHVKVDQFSNFDQV